MTHMKLPASLEGAEPFSDQATEHNRTARQGDGVSKPVVVFESEFFEPQWRLRNQSVIPPEAVAVAFEARSAEGVFELVEHRVGCVPEPLARSQHDLDFSTAVTALTEAYQARTGAADRPKVLHLLHRLQIYAASVNVRMQNNHLFAGSAAGASPRSTTMSAATLASYMAFFQDATQRMTLSEGLPLDVYEAAHVLKSLRDITRHFRNLSLTLPDITDKLATKPVTYPGTLEQLRTRLTQLVDNGLQQIGALQKQRKDIPEATLRQFVVAFVHASHCFAGDGYSPLSDDIRRLVAKVVTCLGRMENDLNTPLFDFFEHLSTRVLAHCDEALADTLQALLQNTTFSGYLGSIEHGFRFSYLTGTLDTLLRHERTALWQLGAQMLVGRCPKEFLKHIKQCVTQEGEGSISVTKLNYIFALLNAASDARPDAGLSTAQFSMDRQAQQRYRGFLDRLAEVNGLHCLTMTGALPEEKERTATNLQAIFGVDKQESERLVTFFCNASFKAAQCLPTNSAITRDLEAMFQKARANPVNDAARFKAFLDTVGEGYRQLPVMRGLILKALGQHLPAPGMLPAEGAALRKLRTVEAWLCDTVIPSYDKMIQLVLGCYPFSWTPEHFVTPHMQRDQLVMTEGGDLFKARFNASGQAWLHSLFGGHQGVHIVPTETYFSAGDWTGLVQDGDARMHDAAVQRSIGSLTQYYQEFQKLDLDASKTESMHALLRKIQVRLQLSAGGINTADSTTRVTADAARLVQNMDSVQHFLKNVSEFGTAHLLGEAKRRFFRDDKLSAHGRKFIGAAFDDIAGDTSEGAAALQTAVADRLFKLGHGAVETLIKDIHVNKLREAVAGIGALIERDRNIHSFRTEEVAESFNTHHSGADTGRSAVVVNAQSTELLRERLYKESEAALKADNIDYIMPNQALAAWLCRNDALQNKNILMKMGTGQGKSVVIATVAMHEAERLDKKKGEHVFVLTGLDALARRDHAKGVNFFSPRGIKSACITQVSDIDSLAVDTAIIYADATTLQELVQKIIIHEILVLIAPNQFKSQPHRLAFLERLYENSHRFILDEYDLVLNDLDCSVGKLTAFGASIIDKKFVDDNAQYSPFLKAAKLVDLETQNQMDSATGLGSTKVNGLYVKSHGQEMFCLRPGALRVSQMLAGAKRIIGLSGSTQGAGFGDVTGLQDTAAEYFEIPSSSDPDSFGTRMVHVPNSKEDLKGLPGIWCVTKKKTDGNEDAYISAIIDDVRAARERRDVPGMEGQSIIRPVLIFADPDNGNLLARLTDALNKAFTDVKLLEKFSPEALNQDGGVDAIGVAGSVTLASIICGRGIDIHVSSSIPDGMHVVIGTSLVTDRLLTQLAGRTGRMGRDGTYSAITLGDLIHDPREKDSARASENTLHDMSRDFIKLLITGGCDKKRALQWLMLTTEQQKGDKEAVAKLRTEFKAKETAR